MLWRVLLTILSQAFQKMPKGVAGGSGSSTGPKHHFFFPEGLNVSKPGHHGGLQGVQSGMVNPVHDLLKGFPKIVVSLGCCREEWIINRNHHDTFSSIVTRFADREEISLLQIPLQPPRLLFFGTNKGILNSSHHSTLTPCRPPW